MLTSAYTTTFLMRLINIPHVRAAYPTECLPFNDETIPIRQHLINVINAPRAGDDGRNKRHESACLSFDSLPDLLPAVPLPKAVTPVVVGRCPSITNQRSSPAIPAPPAVDHIEFPSSDLICLRKPPPPPPPPPTAFITIYN